MNPQTINYGAAPAVLSSFDLNLAELLKWRRKAVKHREYRPLGILERIQLEASGVARVEGNQLVGQAMMSASLDWYKNGPLIALSQDEKHLLFCSPCVAPPPLPDPNWKAPPLYDAKGNWVQANWDQINKPPMVDQKLDHRARGYVSFGTAKFLVFEPIHQALLIRQGKSGWLHLNFSADHQGRHTTMLYNPATSEAHLLYGRFEVVDYQ